MRYWICLFLCGIHFEMASAEDRLGTYQVIGGKTYVCEDMGPQRKNDQKCKDVETGEALRVEKFTLDRNPSKGWIPFSE